MNLPKHMKRTYYTVCCLLFFFTTNLPILLSQNRIDPYNFNQDERRSSWVETESDSVEKQGIPIGQHVWTIDSRFGVVQPAEPDTLHHLFTNHAFTEGLHGHYLTTGNLGSPRISRLFTEQISSMFEHQFIFEQPYDFFITQPDELLFTNTKSPFTNLSYHSCGNKQNGEDRIKGLFYVNVNKRLGIGFKLDYLYGRGYYASQSAAHFNGTLYGSYRGERYDLHAQYYANHLKNSENGGLEEDTYITQPELYPTKYGTADMPTRLSKTWNKMNVNTFHLSHRYKFGFHRYKDEDGNIVSIRPDSTSNSFLEGTLSMKDSSFMVQMSDSAKMDSTQQLIREFIPVASILHTLRIDHNNRRFMSNLPANIHSPHFFNDYYLPGDSANDFTKNIHIENTLALELNEGFNKWAQSGMRLFARHDYFKFTLPETNRRAASYQENYITLGAQILREQGKIFHYHLLGELRSSGKKWGEFNLEGNAHFNIPLKKDTLRFKIQGYARGEEPSFYYQHYHSKNAWWDQNLKRVFRARIGGNISYKKTQLGVNFETLQNYTYFQETITPNYNAEGIYLPLKSVNAQQCSHNIQLLSAMLKQDFKWGILNWENEFVCQWSSDQKVLPVPLFNAYSNLYLKFTIAKVLHTELGADVRYFTKYEAPIYSPIIGQYCAQDVNERIEIGNYPNVNVYVNFDLQHTRFYIMASHVNYSSGSGYPFVSPNYPMNQMVVRFGLSWNFFN